MHEVHGIPTFDEVLLLSIQQKEGAWSLETAGGSHAMTYVRNHTFVGDELIVDLVDPPNATASR